MDGLAAGVELDGIESLEAVIQQFLRVDGTSVLRAGIEYHRDQAPVVTLRGGNHAETGTLGITGFESIDKGITPEQPVAVVLRDVVVTVLPHFVHREVLRKFSDDRVRQRGQIGRRGIVLRIGQAGRIDEVGVLQAEPRRFPVHGLDKGLLAASHAVGQRDRCIVARLHDHAI